MRRCVLWLLPFGAGAAIAFLPFLPNIPLTIPKVLGGVVLQLLAVLAGFQRTKDGTGKSTSWGRAQIALLCCAAMVNVSALFVEDSRKRSAESKLMNGLTGLSAEMQKNLDLSTKNLTAIQDSLNSSERINTTTERTLETANKAVSAITGGKSWPMFVVILPTYLQANGSIDERRTTSPDVQFGLVLVGGHDPLRSLNVHLVQSECRTSDGNDPIGGRLGGHIFYQQMFESFTGRGFDLRGAFQRQISGNRAVFWGQFVAVNGSWEQIVKLRRTGDGWGWRSVVYTNVPNTERPKRKMIFDESSPKYPPLEVRRQILPITAEDCSGPIDRI